MQEEKKRFPTAIVLASEVDLNVTFANERNYQRQPFSEM
jgi:hypothetical protein